MLLVSQTARNAVVSDALVKLDRTEAISAVREKMFILANTLLTTFSYEEHKGEATTTAEP